ncbi:HNH endonuclease signature motif containing protein [Pseudonocardia alaniniphila]|uniref:HNH endonuclease n=1 Tax=Pseudonocardia alaniniphila TaxID=75291 RepID=A0ABS9TM27_9PSEU|nr:HNH endonuclease signature motif containing protein [Pseudonocardia alaniniphila]MCH6169590.1 HNH endonuclease [Pseudonocardia alaniniphila]
MFEYGGVETAPDPQTTPLSWSGYAPDGIMTMLLAQAEPTSDRFELLERIGGWEKIIAWAQARQYEEIAQFVATAETAPPLGLNAMQAVKSAQAEVALMLRMSPGGVAWRVGEARQLVEEFPATFAALHDGAITLTKARIVTDGCADLDPAAAAAVEQKVLPRAPEQTNGQLRAAVRRAVLRADSDSALRRRERKRRERGVVLYPECDGMATLSATLPAAEAVGTFAVLDQHARGCGSTDERSMAARRADALVDLVLRETGFCSNASQRTAEKSTATPRPGSQSGTDSDATPATTPIPAATVASGSIPGTAHSRHATSTAARTRAATPETTTAAATKTTASAVPQPATATSAASTTPTSALMPTETKRSGVGAADTQTAAARTPTDTATTPASSLDDSLQITESGSPVPGSERLPGVAPDGGVPAVTNKVSVQIRVTVPLDTLRGTSNEPGELAGYGPIPAEHARELAADPDSVWRRLVTDPFSGALLDYGTTRYRPPPHLTEHLIARHQYCQHPGCRVPAHLCDLDHNQPYDPANGQGPTSAANLGPKCRPHHRLKGYPGWSLTQYVDGSIVWTTPSGHTYRVDPPPLTEPRPTTATDDEPPPF